MRNSLKFSQPLPFLIIFFSLLLILILPGCSEPQIREIKSAPEPPNINDTTTVLQLHNNSLSESPGSNASGAAESAGIRELEEDVNRSQTTLKEGLVKEGARDELDSLIKKAATLTYTVKYLTSDPLGSGELTVFQRRGESRVDSVRKVNGLSFESRQYILDEGVFLCGRNESWHCIKLPDQENFSLNDSSFSNDSLIKDSLINITPPRVVKSGTRTILGVPTSCYKTFMPNVTTEQCFTKDGVLLLTKSRVPEGEVDWLAASFSRTLPQGVFILPATPKELEFTAHPNS